MAEIIPILRNLDNFDKQIKILTDLCKEDLESINTLIIEKLDSSVPLISKIASYLVVSGGKRLRPLLTSACFNLINNKTDLPLKHIGLAAAVEFIHAATLLHDDVVDESKKRRGNPTANEVWGNKTSVLVGDFLFSRAFQLMTKFGNLEILKILSDTSVTISEGEVLELSNDKNLEINENVYFEVINGKTASLFSAACQVGGISAKANKNQINALRSFGTNFGMAFQLIDDAMDYASSKNKMGKNTGDDFKEGKVTLPIILAYGRSNSSEKKFWKKTITEQNQKPSDFEKALNIIKKYNCVEDTITRAQHFSNVAVDSLDVFNSSDYKDCLINITINGIKRLS